MDQYFATIFEDVGHERNIILLLILVEPDILKHIKFTDHGNDINKNFARKKLYRQRMVKETIA